MSIMRRSACSIWRNSPLHSLRYGALMSGATRAWASLTAPARSRPRTLNFTAMTRAPCSRKMVVAPGRTKPLPAWPEIDGETSSRSRRRGVVPSSMSAPLMRLPVGAGSGTLDPMVEIPLLEPVKGVPGRSATGPSVTVWPVTSTGMSRMASSAERSRSGQRSVISYDFSPSIIRVKGLPPTAV